MLHHDLMTTDGILIITPHGALDAADFERLSEVVDPYIAEHGKLNGLMIYAESFPGWDDFAALIAHVKFVRGHVGNIRRVAAVSDSGILTILPRIAAHFVPAEVRHFEHRDREGALKWLRERTGAI